MYLYHVYVQSYIHCFKHQKVEKFKIIKYYIHYYWLQKINSIIKMWKYEY